MKITTVDTLIDEFRNGRDIWSRNSVELVVREIERLRKENNKLKLKLAASENDLVLFEVSEMLKKTQARVQELEQERRWIPVSERNPHSNGLYDVWITGVHNSISAIYRNGKWNMSGVTHWRCKPQPPKERE